MKKLKKKIFYILFNSKDEKKFNKARLMIEKDEKLKKVVYDEIISKDSLSMNDEIFNLLLIEQTSYNFNSIFKLIDLNTLINIDIKYFFRFLDNKLFERLSQENELKLYNYMMNLNKQKEAFYYCQEVSDVNFRAKLLKKAKTDLSFAYSFILYLKDNSELVDLKLKLEDIIIRGNSNCFKVAIFDLVDDNKKEIIKNSIIESKDAKYIFELAKKYEAPYRTYFIKEIQKTNNLEYMIKALIYLDNTMLYKLDDKTSILGMISILNIDFISKQKLTRDATMLIHNNILKNYQDINSLKQEYILHINNFIDSENESLEYSLTKSTNKN